MEFSIIFWSATTTTCFITILILIYCYTTRHFNHWKRKGVPFEKPVPLFGNFLDVALGKTSPGKQLAYLYNRFQEPYFGIFLLDRPALVVKSPELIKRILIKDFQIFPNRGFAVDERADPITYNSLLSFKGERWKTLRSVLSPTFSSGKMKMMLPLMAESGEDMKKFIGEHLDRTIDVKEVCAKYTTDMIASCAFGIKANSFESENSEFRNAGRKVFGFTFSRSIQFASYFLAPTLVRWFRFKFIEPTAGNFFREAFWKTVNLREETNIKRNDLIDILIELKRQGNERHEFMNLRGDGLVAQAITFFAAGQESTSSAIAFTLYELCLQPELQKRLRDEIRSGIEVHAGVTYEALQEMRYLDMVFSETLRKYPFGPFLIRECEEDYEITESGLLLERGTPVLIPLIGLHYDETYYPDAEKFDPERFSETNKRKIPLYTYLPFGGGPRNCIGDRFALLSGKLGLVYILRDFEVVRSPSTPVPLEFNKRAPLLTASNVPVILRRL